MTLTKQQKELALLGVLIVGILIVLVPFIMGGDDSEVTDSIPAADIISGGNAASGQYDFLPDGFDVDLSVLDDPRFKALNAPSYPTVSPGEYGGKADPFVKQ